MNVLIVGASGYVASIIRPALEAEHACRHFDRTAILGAEDRTIVAGVHDEEAVRRAVKGMDAIIYLAMGGRQRAPGEAPHSGPRHDVGDIEPAFGVSAGGTYRFLAEGLRVGVQRFVFASTMSVYSSEIGPGHSGWEPPDCWHAYGMAKRVGEFVCQAAVQSHPRLTVTAPRLFAPRNEPDFAQLKADAKRWHPCYLGPQDTRRLFLAAVALDKPGFHAFSASGDTTGKHISYTIAQQVLGWSPRGE